MRKAKSLIVQSNWRFSAFKHDLKIPLRFTPKKFHNRGQVKHLASAQGTGKDDQDVEVEVKLELDDYHGKRIWTGYFEDGDSQKRLWIQDLEFKNDRTFGCSWIEDDGTQYTIQGKILKKSGDRNFGASKL